MHISLALLPILLISFISSTVYELENSPLKLLELVVEGYLPTEKASKDPHILAAIKDKEHLFKLLKVDWNYLIKDINRNSLRDVTERPYLRRLQKNLGILLRYKTLDEDWRGLLENVLGKLSELWVHPTAPLNEWRKHISELDDPWKSFISDDSKLQKLRRDEMVANVNEIRGRLGHLYKLDSGSQIAVKCLINRLDELEVTIERISERASKQDIVILRDLEPLFSESSMVRQHINDANLGNNMEILLSVIEELKDLLINKYDILVVLNDLLNLHDLKGFKNGSRYYPFRVHFHNEKLSNLVMQLAYHLKGSHDPKLIQNMYDACQGREGMKEYEQNNLKNIFRIYLQSFRWNSKNQNYLKESILSDEGLTMQLKELIKAALNYPKLSKILSQIESIKTVEDVNQINNFIEQIMNVNLVPYCRKMHLGYEDKSVGYNVLMMDFREIGSLRSLLNSAYSEEISEYLNKEEAALNLTKEYNDLVAMYKRLFLINGGLDFPIPDEPEIRNFIVKMIKNLRGAAPTGNLLSFYYRNVFHALDIPIHQIRENIAEIIANIKKFLDIMATGKNFLETIELKNSEVAPMVMPNEMTPLDLFFETAPFLQALKVRFDLFTSFPGIKLSPFEEKLYDLASRIILIEPEEYQKLFISSAPMIDIIPKDEEGWNKVKVVFQDWLLLLESWKVIIDARGEPSFLNPKFKLHPSSSNPAKS